jgi:hypothetical protein
VASAASAEDAHTEQFTLYQHAKRPDWGFAIAVAHLVDRKIFVFENGESRTFMNEYTHFMSEVEPAEDVATKARQALAKHAARATASAAAPVKKKSGARKAAASKAKASGAAAKPEQP